MLLAKGHVKAVVQCTTIRVVGEENRRLCVFKPRMTLIRDATVSPCLMEKPSAPVNMHLNDWNGKTINFEMILPRRTMTGSGLTTLRSPRSIFRALHQPEGTRNDKESTKRV